MSNAPLDLLIRICTDNLNEKSHLWLLGEASSSQAIEQILALEKTCIITNRWSELCAGNERLVFNDFNLSLPQIAPFPRCVYLPIPKERPQLNYLVNQCAQYLPVGGQLFVSGEKNQGIKSLAKAASQLFGESNTEKHGNQYLVTLEKTRSVTDSSALLNDKRYKELRPIMELGNLTCYSKPGVFGWDKQDAGSALLIDYLSQSLIQFEPDRAEVLDLGCGYGYLTMSASSLGFKKLYATDNNAAALLAIDENAKQNNIDIEYWPDDVGKNIDRSFDLVLCNPPFHQGFDHQKSITQEFIGQMARLTSPTGTALVVVNQFIGLQPLAAKVFSNVEIVAENKSFKVFSCRR